MLCRYIFSSRDGARAQNLAPKARGGTTGNPLTTSFFFVCLFFTPSTLHWSLRSDQLQVREFSLTFLCWTVSQAVSWSREKKWPLIQKMTTSSISCPSGWCVHGARGAIYIHYHLIWLICCVGFHAGSDCLIVSTQWHTALSCIFIVVQVCKKKKKTCFIHCKHIRIFSLVFKTEIDCSEICFFIAYE